MRARVSALNNVDLPTLGRPTMPQRMGMAQQYPASGACRCCGCSRRRIATVQASHGTLRSLREQHWYDIGGGSDRLLDELRVRCGGPAEHVVEHLRPIARMTDTDTQPPEAIAHLRDHIA